MVVLLTSYIFFKRYYVNPSYEDWRWKTNPKYPSPEMVRSEILTSMKGVIVVTICPALSLYLAQHGKSKGYCGITEEYDLRYTIMQFFAVWLVSDFYEFFFHWCGHRFTFLWKQHASHHRFFNPSPFAVIADDWFDQFFRGLPLLVFPMIVPINVDLMFGQWTTLFYFYGTYIHLGYEFPWLNAHQPIINTSYHHHLHHAISTNKKPLHTGFFFKAWDQLFGSTHTGKCFCCPCQHEQGKRTEKEFKTIEIPDYSVLLQPKFWFENKEVKSK
eukprot:CAMPEP_0203759658 /NCGR_PEP_ID=MMETSP0098-20131031/12763_1 /ASSEMBLY_ACC=CAM_ASM_000208 /TAXON_ID=96639 /ORGANISM=" , Strain NY0313808BC1" /LENGTH=271 /DNA_ID=CAMNT_0050652765 /DNA_START=274 /DNA_END=1089 /DNA_ORIENTATION=+